MEESKCSICGAGFRKASLNKDGKCTLCAVLYPDAKSPEDIKNKDNKTKARTLTEQTVKDLVYEILEEANIKRKKCEKCEKLFFPNSPAQRTCSVCKSKGDN